MFSTQRLFEAGGIGVTEFLCTASRHEDSSSLEVTTEHELVFVRRGVFVLETGDVESIITPNHAMLFVAGEPYRIRHPVDGGDECLIVAIPPEHFDEAMGSRRRTGVRIAGPGAFLTQQRLAIAARRGHASEIESRAFELLATVAPSTVPATRHNHVKAIRRVQELLSVHYAEPLPLSLLAREADLSPWQLSRSFRGVTGRSLHRYQNSLRLRAAVLRLDEGETDLTTLALDLGFCDHSHFTSAFKREFGAPPSRIRERHRHGK